MIDPNSMVDLQGSIWTLVPVAQIQPISLSQQQWNEKMDEQIVKLVEKIRQGKDSNENRNHELYNNNTNKEDYT